MLFDPMPAALQLVVSLYKKLYVQLQCAAMLCKIYLLGLVLVNMVTCSLKLFFIYLIGAGAI